MHFGGENAGFACAVQFEALREAIEGLMQRRSGEGLRGMRLARFGFWAGGLLTSWGQTLQARSHFGEGQFGVELADDRVTE